VNFFLSISKAIDWFTTKLGQAMWWTSLIMVLVGAFNVITRYSFPLLSNLFGDWIRMRHIYMIYIVFLVVIPARYALHIWQTFRRGNELAEQDSEGQAT